MAGKAHLLTPEEGTLSNSTVDDVEGDSSGVNGQGMLMRLPEGPPSSVAFMSQCPPLTLTQDPLAVSRIVLKYSAMGWLDQGFEGPASRDGISGKECEGMGIPGLLLHFSGHPAEIWLDEVWERLIREELAHGQKMDLMLQERGSE